MEPYTNQEHDIFRDQFRRFCEKEIAPLVDEAERNQVFPRNLFPIMGQMGFLCIRYPEEYGGAGADKITDVILREELSRVCQGIATSWSGHSHLATYPIFRLGSEEQRQKYLVPAIKGDKIGAFALTEPDAGSDTKSLRSTATRTDQGYMLRGSKTFIS
ncbi:MAG: acyl-CoA dehydrogenase family protein, partial [Proteobacteria bacterium]|nr:acyl-CoA dehydrogenase family protein [Pseudomonadota bacterium]